MIAAALIAVFAGLAGVAVAFVAAPAFRAARGRPGVLLAAALGLFVIGIATGTYLMLGRPALALRALEGDRTRDINGLIVLLVDQLRARPTDVRGWTILGRAYLTAGDDQDAAKAFAHAIALTNGHPSAELYSAYGEALVGLADNAVPPEAETAFREAFSLDPHDRAARYFLGFAYAARGKRDKAIASWQSLIDEAPPDAPWRQELVDRIAMLKADSGAAPDIHAMVAGLAARLAREPADPDGWERLIRAYSVLGDRARALAALADARKALAKDHNALGTLSAEAKELKLEK